MTSQELDKYVIKYLNGDKQAFESIYFETENSVYLSIYLIIKNKQTIEDLMQDTYMKAIEKMSTYELGTNFKAWISRIARNTAINHYNKYKRISILDDSNVVFESEDASPKLKYYLSFLESNEKDVVIYHLILKMKFKEISKILDIPLSTAFQIYKKALKRIKKEI